MKFKKVSVECSTETSDAVAYALHEAGSMGEVFDDYNNICQVLEEKRWDYADASLFERTDGCKVSGYFTVEDDTDAIKSKIFALGALDYADFSGLKVDIETIDSAEWENEWKKYYKPFHIGKIVVVPEWINYTPVGDDVPIKLNPGLAFGTGMHETTSMCIDLMQRIPLSGNRVLDFGCGSGILGVCATALGASSVVFADTDEQAIRATEYNCSLNGIENPEILCKDVREMQKPADIVIANITADVLISVCPIIESALKNGGYAIISGIIADRKDAVKDVYCEKFTLVDVEQKNEWSAFLFKL